MAWFGSHQSRVSFTVLVGLGSHLTLDLLLDLVPGDIGALKEEEVGTGLSEQVLVLHAKELPSLVLEVLLVLLLDLGYYLLKIFLLDICFQSPHFLRCSSRKIGVLDHTENVLLESVGHVSELALHRTVPMVLDGVVSAALEDLGDLSPLVL